MDDICINVCSFPCCCGWVLLNAQTLCVCAWCAERLINCFEINLVSLQNFGPNFSPLVNSNLKFTNHEIVIVWVKIQKVTCWAWFCYSGFQISHLYCFVSSTCWLWMQSAVRRCLSPIAPSLTRTSWICAVPTVPRPCSTVAMVDVMCGAAAVWGDAVDRDRAPLFTMMADFIEMSQIIINWIQISACSLINFDIWTVNCVCMCV